MNLFEANAAPGDQVDAPSKGSEHALVIATSAPGAPRAPFVLPRKNPTAPRATTAPTTAAATALDCAFGACASAVDTNERWVLLLTNEY